MIKISLQTFAEPWSGQKDITKYIYIYLCITGTNGLNQSFSIRDKKLVRDIEGPSTQKDQDHSGYD